MRFIFFSDVFNQFENWDWRNPDLVGIGGSETSHIELSKRLALRGHEVISYAPVPFTGERIGPGGIGWRHSDSVDTKEPCDVWVVYRSPRMIDWIDHPNVWLLCQDTDYTIQGNELTQERSKAFNRIIALCPIHERYLKLRYPNANICLSSNGIKTNLIEEIEKEEEGVPRNSHRLMYASSPDRGLELLLKLFPRIKEVVTDAELHVFYGFDNIDKVIKVWGENSHAGQQASKVKRGLQQPGVVWHGRTAQPELIREWFKTGVFVHPSNFTETGFITCMEAQACGAIPITNPIWAAESNVLNGVLIEGDVNCEAIQSRYVLETIRMLLDPERQSSIRRKMMPQARRTFDWDHFAAQFEYWAGVDQEIEMIGRALTGEAA